jgi:hypothetical protein
MPANECDPVVGDLEPVLLYSHPHGTWEVHALGVHDELPGVSTHSAGEAVECLPIFVIDGARLSVPMPGAFDLQAVTLPVVRQFATVVVEHFF